jgi:membrane protease YdiL (CAAX protease family)
MTEQNIHPVDLSLEMMRSVKTRILITLEILAVFAVFVVLRVILTPTRIVQWEFRNLEWSYTIMILFVAITALIILLTRRKWAEYGVSSLNWQTNLEIGMKAFLVSFIPLGLGWGGVNRLGLDPNQMSGGAYIALMELAGIVVLLWVINRQKTVPFGRQNLITILLLLLIPIVVALAMGRLSVVVISTVIWQFIFSGFGEEFTFRGYFQSRLNQAFGRPLMLFGIQFGVGLIVSSLLFGLWHAFNTYDPAVGLSSLAWGWALSTFMAGLFLGVIREKTGSLLAPGIAHGLPDAFGEGLKSLFTWM